MLSQPEVPNINFNDDVKLQHLHRLIHLLLPFLKQIREEQEKEIVMEARAQGVSRSSVKIEHTNCDRAERIFCDLCSTSIVDLHRYCSECKFEICLICCLEIRRNFNTDIHGGTLTPKISLENTSTSQSDSSLDSPNLVAENNGSLFCLSKCGKSLMYLRHILEETWISNLEARAENIMNKFEIKLPPKKKHDSISSETSGDSHFRAADKKGSDVLAKDDLIRFRRHLTKGEPVVIRDVLDHTCGISWEPMVMSRALCEHVDPNISSKMSKLKVIDCLNGCTTTYRKLI